MATICLFIGCGIFILLAVAHGAATLFTDKFEPINADLLQALKTNGAKITNRREGNMWQGITGFHLSHSLGMGVFGIFYIAAHIENPVILASSLSLNVLLLLVTSIYILLAQRYWFYIPRNGFISALVCFIGYGVFR